MSYEVIDNFLKEEDFKNIQNQMMSDNFPWFYNKKVLSEEVENIYNYQLTHTFFKDSKPWSDWLEILDPIVDLIKPNALLRIKANLNPGTENYYEHGWHVDYTNVQCKTCVLYINTNNGYTVFKENNEKVYSLENRFVRFDSDMEHSGSTCTDSKVRIVLNINYI